MLTKLQKKKLAGFLSPLEEMTTEIETIADDLESKIDAKSEKWQEGEQGETALTEKEAVGALRDCVQGAIDALGEIEINQ